MLTEATIQHAVAWDLIRRGHKFVLPNISWSMLYWEADLLTVTQSGYLNEFEIKVSKSDFMNDFKKKKHYHLQRPNVHMKIPNYFWYIAPIRAIPICVPDYAGLIEVIDRETYISVRDVRKPKRLHDRKIEDLDMLPALRATMFKYWKLLGSFMGIS